MFSQFSCFLFALSKASSDSEPAFPTESTLFDNIDFQQNFRVPLVSPPVEGVGSKRAKNPKNKIERLRSVRFSFSQATINRRDMSRCQQQINFKRFSVKFCWKTFSRTEARDLEFCGWRTIRMTCWKSYKLKVAISHYRHRRAD